MIKYTVFAKNKYTGVYHLEVKNFSGGEVGVKVLCPSISSAGHVDISAKIKSSDDVMALLNLVDAIRRAAPSGVLINLYMPYFPYARQDRVCNEGESLSVKVFSDLLDTCKFSQITVLDPHSDVCTALLDAKVLINHPHRHFKNEYSCSEWADTYIISPDAGATKRCNKFAEAVGAKGVIVANKVRDMLTGEIKSYSIGDVGFLTKAVVLDDILDGGRTFIELADCLQGKVGSLDLFVSHGIFSRGYSTISKLFNRVVTTNSFIDKDDIPSGIENIKVVEVI